MSSTEMVDSIGIDIAIALPWHKQERTRCTILHGCGNRTTFALWNKYTLFVAKHDAREKGFLGAFVGPVLLHGMYIDAFLYNSILPSKGTPETCLNRSGNKGAWHSFYVLYELLLYL